MTRLALCGILAFATVVAVEFPRACRFEPGWTLGPNELWNRFGGAVFEDECCDPIERCEVTEKCEGTAEVACGPFGKEEVNPPNSNLRGCNDGPDGVTCTVDDQDNICLEIWSCQWNMFTDECEKFQFVDTEEAPRSCVDTCD